MGHHSETHESRYHSYCLRADLRRYWLREYLVGHPLDAGALWNLFITD